MNAIAKIVGEGIPPRRIALGAIRIDSTYQRDLDAAKVRRIVAQFDVRRLDPILLSARAKSLWCIDGSHRLAALRELGAPSCLATVLEGLTQREEADLFITRQRDRKSLNAWDLFKAAEVAGYPDVLAIIRIVHSVGLRLHRSSGAHNIAAIGALQRIYRLGAEPLLAQTLQLVTRAWAPIDNDRRAYDGIVLEGLALFLHSFMREPHYDSDRTERVLTRHAPIVFVRKSQDLAQKYAVGAASATLVGEAIRDSYNERIPRPKKLGAMRQKVRSPRR